MAGQVSTTDYIELTRSASHP